MKRLLPVIIIVATAAWVSCGGEKGSGENPFFTEWDTPYDSPPFDQIKAEHYLPAFEEGMRIHNEEIQAIIDNEQEPGFDNVIAAFDASGELLGTVSRIFSLICSADETDELREVKKEVAPLQSRHSDNIYMNEALFAKVKAVYDKRAQLGLDSYQERLLDNVYRNFEDSGANLSPEDKERMKKINSDLSMANIKFNNNVLEANNAFLLVIDTADLAGLPRNVRNSAAELAEQRGESGRFAFNLSKPSMLPFLTYSERGDLREKLYRGYIERCNYDSQFDNRELVNEIVRLRTERANLQGRETYAQFALENCMAKTPSAVYALLDELWTPSLERAKEELAEMKRIKQAETGSSDFASWDWWYYAEKVRKEKYDLDEEMLRPYFSLDQVRQGIFDLSNRLYGVTFRPINIPVYHRDCITYEVLDKDNSHLGLLIMDFYPREGRKKVGAWCGSYRGRTYRNGEKVADPIVTIVCNFTPPTEKPTKTPSLLSLDETTTFFHEFGHALHSLFTDVPYSGISRVERDFVELPSQIMENWALEPVMLRKYAMHYSSGAVIPDNLIEKIQNSGLFNQGFIMTEKLAASYSDMDIYNIPGFTGVDVNSFENQVLNMKRGLIPEIEPRYRFPYFLHILSGGYAAGYYSYTWSEVLDKDAYEAFVETGDLFNPAVAARFREEVLSKGGSADGETLYRNFRGRDASRDPILYALGIKERPSVEDEIVFQLTAVDPESESLDDTVEN